MTKEQIEFLLAVLEKVQVSGKATVNLYLSVIEALEKMKEGKQ